MYAVDLPSTWKTTLRCKISRVLKESLTFITLKRTNCFIFRTSCIYSVCSDIKQLGAQKVKPKLKGFIDYLKATKKSPMKPFSRRPHFPIMQLVCWSSMFEVSSRPSPPHRKHNPDVPLFANKLQLSCVCLCNSEAPSIPSTAPTCTFTFNPPFN